MPRTCHADRGSAATLAAVLAGVLLFVVAHGCRGPGASSGQTGTAASQTEAATQSVPEAADSNPAPSVMAQCERNLRALVMAAQAYEQQTGGVLDPKRWPEQLRPFLRATGSDEEVMGCPAAESAAGPSYALAAKPAPGSHDAVIFFESAGKLSGGPGDMAFRHADCGLVATRSGRVLHVTRHDAAQAAKTHRLTADVADDGDVLSEKATATW